jgi:HSP20 family protein
MRERRYSSSGGVSRQIQARGDEHEEEREGFFASERSYGSFCRVVPLPEGAIADTARAKFANGVLEVTVDAPPREVSRGRKVEISS